MNTFEQSGYSSTFIGTEQKVLVPVLARLSPSASLNLLIFSNFPFIMPGHMRLEASNTHTGIEPR